MSASRWLACALCLVTVDGAWFQLLLAFAGFVAGLGHAPVPFAVCWTVMAAAVVAALLTDVAAVSWPWARRIAPAVAALAVWLAVSLAVPGVGIPGGVAWPLDLLAGRLAGPQALALTLVVLVCGGLWRHGMARGRGDAGAGAIARSFRAGLIVMVTVLALEAAGNLDLGTRAVLVPFFLATLAGMAMARVPAQGGVSRSWLLMVGATVALVLVGGLTLAGVAVAAVRGGAGALWTVWVDLARAASESVSATLSVLLGTGPAPGLGFEPAAMDPPESLMLLVLIAGGLVMAALGRRLLSTPPGEKVRVVLDLAEEERESVAASDTPVLARLVDAVLPSRWRRRRAASMRDAPGEPGISDVMALYRRALLLARRRGVALNPAHTPFERAAQLSRALPGVPVQTLTGRFVAACYGGERAPPQVVARLTRALDAAERGDAPGT